MIERINSELRSLFEGIQDSAHSLDHISRVYDLSVRLQEKEGGDLEVIHVGAMLHDLHQLLASRHGRFFSGRESLPLAREVLEKVEFPSVKISEVLHCIEVHDQYDFALEGNGADSIEAKIIQDADNLDAIGAVGIARVFGFGGAYNRPIWDGKIRTGGHYKDRVMSDSSLQHFYDKLLRLKDHMNTDTAREIAEGRHNFVEAFLERFKKEWAGEL
jgi:uncharacterized protein